MKKNEKKQVKKAGVKKVDPKKNEVKRVHAKKEKDPRKVEAAKKAWETIRAKAKENQNEVIS